MKEDNQQSQQEATDDVLKDYNSDGVRILHQAQHDFNQHLQEEREKDHRNYKAIEAEATQVLAKAEKEGAIHIKERHGTDPVIFFSSGEKIMVYEKGKISEACHIPGEGNYACITTYWSGDQIKVLMMPYVVGDQSKGRAVRRLRYHKSEGDITGTLGQEDVDYCWFYDFVCPKDDGNEIALTGRSVWVLGKGVYEPKEWKNWKDDAIGLLKGGYFPKICFDTKNELAYYIHNSSWIRQVNLSDVKNQSHQIILDNKVFDSPIDIVHNHVNNSLIIMDEGKKEIGVHLVGYKHFIAISTPAEHFVKIPKQVIKNKESFTISCHIKRFSDAKISRPAGTLLGFWIEEKDSKQFLHYRTIVNGVFDERNFEITRHLSENQWHQVTWQKEKEVYQFYVDGKRVHIDPVPAPEQIEMTYPSQKELPFCIAFPGFYMAELRIWNTVRSAQKIKRYTNCWLRPNDIEGLAGYWRLDGVALERIVKGKVETIAWPDLSGNEYHIQSMERHMISTHEDSPFATIMPIYDLKVCKQGLKIDETSGKIYWIDEDKDGRVCLMIGSTLGHLEPHPLFEIEWGSTFDVINNVESIYEKLIIAHYKRRDVMKQAMISVSMEQQTGHEKVLKAHQQFSDALESVKAPIRHSNSSTYQEKYNEWLQVLDQIHEAQDHLNQKVKAKKETALQQANQITNLAKESAKTITKAKKTSP